MRSSAVGAARRRSTARVGGVDGGGVAAGRLVDDDHEARPARATGPGPGARTRPRRAAQPAAEEVRMEAGHTIDCNTYDAILQGSTVESFGLSPRSATRLTAPIAAAPTQRRCRSAALARAAARSSSRTTSSHRQRLARRPPRPPSPPRSASKATAPSRRRVGADRRQRRREHARERRGRRSRPPTGPRGSAARARARPGTRRRRGCRRRRSIAVGGSAASSSVAGRARRRRRSRSPSPAHSAADGSTPTARSAARQRASRIWNVGYCTREPSWRDPPVAELDQVRERGVGAARGVQRDPRDALRARPR